MSDIYAENMGRHATEFQRYLQPGIAAHGNGTTDERERLDEQFDLLNRNIGYLLHPTIVSRLSQSPVIADVGTGTGRFLSMLAREYPSATLRGFDISSALYPTLKQLPQNVELGVMDVKQVPPSEEHARYDVVNARLLTAAMDPEDWARAVSNIVMLLKPGGAIQWEEGDFAHVRHLRGEVTSSTSAARSMGILFHDALQKKFSHGWNTLPQIMLDSGLARVEEDIVSSDRIVETREAVTANGMVAMFDWARLMSKRGVPGSWSMEQLRGLEEQANKDVKSGCYVRYDIHIVFGFKPSS